MNETLAWILQISLRHPPQLTKSFRSSSAEATLDRKFQFLRALRRLEERRARRTRNLQDVGDACSLQKTKKKEQETTIRRLMDKLGRLQCKCFCARLDVLKPYSKI